MLIHIYLYWIFYTSNPGQNAASKFLPSHTFLARKMEAPPSSFSNASKTTTTAFRHLPPPPSHLTKTQPNFWSQQQAFGKDRASTFGASHAGRQYLLPPEFSSVGPTCSVPLMKPAAPPNAYSVFRFGQQNSHNSCSQIPASSCLLSHQDGNVQQSLLSNSQASSKFSNSCFSQSYAKGSRAKSFGTSQSQAFSSCSIDTAQIASITKEVSDAMENKAKLILDQLADKENIMDKKTQDWEMKLNQKGEFLFQQLDTKASDWDAKMTESMSTLATMNDTVKREVASFDSRVKASESMFKKHGRMLDEKAQEIHSLGSAMLKKIRNAGGEVIRGARDAGDLIRSSKTNIVSAFFECLDPTIANVLGRTGTALNSKPIPALSDSPAITFETDSKSDSELRIRSREMKSSPDSAKMSESLASPTMRGQCKRRSPHLNPLELIIKPSNAVIGSASKTQRQKRTKKFSSSTSFCITPSDNKRTDHGLSQKVFSKEYPSPLKDSTPPITVPEDKKRRRISSGNGKRRRRAMRLMDESQLGFSSFGAS